MRRNGATGTDAIPHIEMWKDLPFLVRDGTPRARFRGGRARDLAHASAPRDGRRRCAGIFFSIDTIKSKGKAQYQSYL